MRRSWLCIMREREIDECGCLSDEDGAVVQMDALQQGIFVKVECTLPMCCSFSSSREVPCHFAAPSTTDLIFNQSEYTWINYNQYMALK